MTFDPTSDLGKAALAKVADKLGSRGLCVSRVYDQGFGAFITVTVRPSPVARFVNWLTGGFCGNNLLYAMYLEVDGNHIELYYPRFFCGVAKGLYQARYNMASPDTMESIVDACTRLSKTPVSYWFISDIPKHVRTIEIHDRKLPAIGHVPSLHERYTCFNLFKWTVVFGRIKTTYRR